MVIMHVAVMVSLFEIGSDGRPAYERSRGKPYGKMLRTFGECACVCSIFRWTEHEAERTSCKRSSSMECISDLGWAPPRCASARRQVLSESQSIKRKTEHVERTCRCPLGHRLQEHSVKVMRYQQHGIPLQKAAATTSAANSAWWSERSSRPTHSLHPCRCGHRENWDDFRLSRMRRDLDEEHTEQSHCSVQREKHDRDAK